MPHFVAVTEDGCVVGWCDIAPLDRPVFKHAGSLGQQLIEAALNASKGRGLTRIELTVRESNASAIRLYEKMGFGREGLHKNAVLIDEHYENHLSMALLW